MNKFEKCKTCSNFRGCKYIEKGELCYEKLNPTAYETTCECVQGKTVDIGINHNDSEIRLDLIIEKKKVSKLWGQVKDTKGFAVEGALVSLLKPQYIRGNLEYYPISTTISDCMGFYQFEIDQLEKGLKYRVSAGKS
jgi:hypothetical protein